MFLQPWLSISTFQPVFVVVGMLVVCRRCVCDRVFSFLAYNAPLFAHAWSRPLKVGADESTDVAMLNVVSFSSWALLALLGRWSSLSPRKGGLKDSAARASSGDFLQALCLMVAGQMQAFSISIDLALDWVVK